MEEKLFKALVELKDAAKTLGAYTHADHTAVRSAYDKATAIINEYNAKPVEKQADVKVAKTKKEKK